MKNSYLVIAALALAACGDDGAPKDYLKIAGGGITFNYRYSEAGMVLIAQQKYPLPNGSKLEVQFDVPNSTKRETVSLPAIDGKITYKLQSSPMIGFKKGGEYRVTLRLLDNSGKELDRDETQFISDEDQSTLPTKPLVDGPAFTPHLENL